MYATRHCRFATGFVVHGEVQHPARSLAVAIFNRKCSKFKVQGVRMRSKK